MSRLVSTDSAAGLGTCLDVILAARTLDEIAIQYARPAVFVHVGGGSVDRMLAGAIAARRQFLIERDATVTVEHGRCCRDDCAACGGWIGVADEGFGHWETSKTD